MEFITKGVAMSDYEKALAWYREQFTKDPPEGRTADEIELMAKVMAENDGVFKRLADYDKSD